jgi:RNA polymerase sigma factor (sigma-70 family)
MQLSAARNSTHPETSDEVLAALAAEDFEAFAELYRRYLNPVYRFLRSQTPSEAVAEDLTAHVFFKALSSAATFRGDGTYKSWIFRIAHNVLVSWRERRGRSVAIEDLPDEEDPGPSPASQAIEVEERDFVWQKVAELPAAQREVITLKYAEDLSTEEIAKVTNKSRGAVRILLHRARSKLRHAFEGKDLL